MKNGLFTLFIAQIVLTMLFPFVQRDINRDFVAGAFQVSFALFSTFFRFFERFQSALDAFPRRLHAMWGKGARAIHGDDAKALGN